MAAYHITVPGTFIHPWLNRPDTKFNEDGLYHVDVRISGKDAEDLAAKIEQASKAALDLHLQDMKPGEAKKWSLYLPFEREEDEDTGEPTGDIVFNFKQNAKIRSKKERSGFKEVKIDLRDSQNNAIDVAIWDGSVGRVMFSMRTIVMVSNKSVGVRLDFAKVQIIKLQQGSGGRGFDVVEDGYVADGDDQQFDRHDSQSEDDGGDY